VGAFVGGCIAYAVGATAFDTLGARMLGWVGVAPDAVETRRDDFERHGWAVVALSTVTPLPTKIVCLAAGAFGVPLWAFGAALLLGRGARFAVVAAFCRVAGARLAKE
jgi:membrane protein YqaA with SNARE-associated domain